MAFMIESNLYGSHCMFCNKKISKIFKGNALLYDNMFSFLQEYTKENNCRTTIHFLSRLWKFIYTAFFEIRHAHYILKPCIAIFEIKKYMQLTCVVTKESCRHIFF